MKYLRLLLLFVVVSTIYIGGTTSLADTSYRDCHMKMSSNYVKKELSDKDWKTGAEYFAKNPNSAGSPSIKAAKGYSYMKEVFSYGVLDEIKKYEKEISGLSSKQKKNLRALSYEVYDDALSKITKGVNSKYKDKAIKMAKEYYKKGWLVPVSNSNEMITESGFKDLAVKSVSKKITDAETKLIYQLYKLGNSYGASIRQLCQGSVSTMKSIEDTNGGGGVVGDKKLVDSADYLKKVNDGTARNNIKDIYIEMKDFPSTFDDKVKYVDVLIPYKVKCKTIGGFSSNKERLQGTVGNDYAPWSKYSNVQQIATSTGSTMYYTKSSSGKKEDSGVGIMEDKKGYQYIGTAVQAFFYGWWCDKNPGHTRVDQIKKLKHFYGAGAELGNKAGGLRGGIIDAICADGTVIHLVAVDENASEHTNGGVGGGSVKLKNYHNIASAQTGNNLEVVWSGTKASSLIGNSAQLRGTKKPIKNIEDNPIVAYRVYNTNLNRIKQGKDKYSSTASKTFVSKVGALDGGNIPTGSSSTSGGKSAKQQAADALAANKLTESSYASKTVLNETSLVFTDISDYSADEVYNLKSWQEDISEGTIEDWLIRGGRIFVLLFGILVIIWMVFIYIAYWFDRINNILDIELLPIITLGKLVKSPDEKSCTYNVRDLAKGEKRTINNKNLMVLVISGIIIGCLIVSGTLFSILMGIVTWVTEQFGKYL